MNHNTIGSTCTDEQSEGDKSGDTYTLESEAKVGEVEELAAARRNIGREFGVEDEYYNQQDSKMAATIASGSGTNRVNINHERHVMSYTTSNNLDHESADDMQQTNGNVSAYQRYEARPVGRAVGIAATQKTHSPNSAEEYKPPSKNKNEEELPLEINTAEVLPVMASMDKLKRLGDSVDKAMIGFQFRRARSNSLGSALSKKSVGNFRAQLEERNRSIVSNPETQTESLRKRAGTDSTRHNLPSNGSGPKVNGELISSTEMVGLTNGDPTGVPQDSACAPIDINQNKLSAASSNSINLQQNRRNPSKSFQSGASQLPQPQPSSSGEGDVTVHSSPSAAPLPSESVLISDEQSDLMYYSSGDDQQPCEEDTMQRSTGRLDTPESVINLLTDVISSESDQLFTSNLPNQNRTSRLGKVPKSRTFSEIASEDSDVFQSPSDSFFSHTNSLDRRHAGSVRSRGRSEVSHNSDLDFESEEDSIAMKHSNDTGTSNTNFQHRSLNTANTPVRINPSATSSFNRRDGGRHSMRVRKSAGSRVQHGVTVDSSDEESMPSDVKKLAQDFDNFRRRMKYDPMKAAQLAKEHPPPSNSPSRTRRLWDRSEVKAEVAKESNKQSPADLSTSPAKHSTSLHSFTHPTSASDSTCDHDLHASDAELGHDQNDYGPGPESHLHHDTSASASPFQRSLSVGKAGAGAGSGYASLAKPNRTFYLRRQRLGLDMAANAGTSGNTSQDVKVGHKPQAANSGSSSLSPSVRSKQSSQVHAKVTHSSSSSPSPSSSSASTKSSIPGAITGHARDRLKNVATTVSPANIRKSPSSNFSRNDGGRHSLRIKSLTDQETTGSASSRTGRNTPNQLNLKSPRASSVLSNDQLQQSPVNRYVGSSPGSAAAGNLRNLQMDREYRRQERIKQLIEKQQGRRGNIPSSHIGPNIQPRMEREISVPVTATASDIDRDDDEVNSRDGDFADEMINDPRHSNTSAYPAVNEPSDSDAYSVTSEIMTRPSGLPRPVTGRSGTARNSRRVAGRPLARSVSYDCQSDLLNGRAEENDLFDYKNQYLRPSNEPMNSPAIMSQSQSMTSQLGHLTMSHLPMNENQICSPTSSTSTEPPAPVPPPKTHSPPHMGTTGMLKRLSPSVDDPNRFTAPTTATAASLHIGQHASNPFTADPRLDSLNYNSDQIDSGDSAYYSTISGASGDSNHGNGNYGDLKSEGPLTILHSPSPLYVEPQRITNLSQNNCGSVSNQLIGALEPPSTVCFTDSSSSPVGPPILAEPANSRDSPLLSAATQEKGSESDVSVSDAIQGMLYGGAPLGSARKSARRQRGRITPNHFNNTTPPSTLPSSASVTFGPNGVISSLSAPTAARLHSSLSSVSSGASEEYMSSPNRQYVPPASSSSGSSSRHVTPVQHAERMPPSLAQAQASYDQLVITSIFNLAQKLRSNTSKTMNKLRDGGFLSDSLLPSDLDQPSEPGNSWKSTNQQLTAVLANLLKVDQHVHVIGKGVSQTLSAVSRCERKLEEQMDGGGNRGHVSADRDRHRYTAASSGGGGGVTTGSLRLHRTRHSSASTTKALPEQYV